MPQPATPAGTPTRRRANRLFGLALILVACSLALPAGASAYVSAGGATGSAQPLRGGPDYFGVVFVDATHGWASGGSGQIVATTDGGATWDDRSCSSRDDVRIAFIDATHGWVVGASGAIFATSDGGATWKAQSSGTTANLTAVAFIDATHGWVVGDGGAILVTSDGGATWKAQTSGSSKDLSGLAFSDATHGWAVGFEGTILATSDGGVTWRAQTSGSGDWLWGVAALDATHVWAVGGTYDPETKTSTGTILATTDGGATWSKQMASSSSLSAIDFVDATHGWAAGFDGLILATTNGGATWSKQSSGSSRGLGGIAFPDATHGWAVGQAGTILATTDGGASWTKQNQGSSAPMIAKLKPASGKRGATVTISGTDFAAAQDAGAVRFGTAKCTTYVSWSDTQIKCKVPAKAKLGKVSVTVTNAAGTSNPVSFTVKR